MTDISIIIVNYNGKEYIKDCLDSLQKNSAGIEHEIIIVDNASTDGSQSFIRNSYPIARLIENKANLGFSKANNVGIRAASGRYIMLLNNDTIIKKGSIKYLLDYIEGHDDVGAVGPKLLNVDGSIQYQCRRGFPTPAASLFYFTGLYRLFQRSKYVNSYLMTYLDDKSSAEVDSLCGAAMLVRKETIDQAGMLDEDYFMYGDDIDWCYRIKQKGWKVKYLPEAEIVHLGGRTSRKRSYRNIYEFYKAMMIFYNKHYSKGYLFLVNWLIYAAIWSKFSIAFLQNYFRKEKYAGTKKP